MIFSSISAIRGTHFARSFDPITKMLAVRQLHLQEPSRLSFFHSHLSPRCIKCQSIISCWDLHAVRVPSICGVRSVKTASSPASAVERKKEGKIVKTTSIIGSGRNEEGPRLYNYNSLNIKVNRKRWLVLKTRKMELERLRQQAEKVGLGKKLSKKELEHERALEELGMGTTVPRDYLEGKGDPYKAEDLYKNVVKEVDQNPERWTQLEGPATLRPKINPRKETILGNEDVQRNQTPSLMPFDGANEEFVSTLRPGITNEMITPTPRSDGINERMASDAIGGENRHERKNGEQKGRNLTKRRAKYNAQNGNKIHSRDQHKNDGHSQANRQSRRRKQLDEQSPYYVLNNYTAGMPRDKWLAAWNEVNHGKVNRDLFKRLCQLYDNSDESPKLRARALSCLRGYYNKISDLADRDRFSERRFVFKELHVRKLFPRNLVVAQIFDELLAEEPKAALQMFKIWKNEYSNPEVLCDMSNEERFNIPIGKNWLLDAVESKCSDDQEQLKQLTPIRNSIEPWDISKQVTDNNFASKSSSNTLDNDEIKELSQGSNEKQAGEQLEEQLEECKQSKQNIASDGPKDTIDSKSLPPLVRPLFIYTRAQAESAEKRAVDGALIAIVMDESMNRNKAYSREEVREILQPYSMPLTADSIVKSAKLFKLPSDIWPVINQWLSSFLVAEICHDPANCANLLTRLFALRNFKVCALAEEQILHMKFDNQREVFDALLRGWARSNEAFRASNILCVMDEKSLPPMRDGWIELMRYAARRKVPSAIQKFWDDAIASDATLIKDEVFWNMHIQCISISGRDQTALREIHNMINILHFNPSVATFNIAIGYMGDSGNVKMALELFQLMLRKGVEPNQEIINTILRVFILNNEWDRASNILNIMQRHEMSFDADSFAALMEQVGIVAKRTFYIDERLQRREELREIRRKYVEKLEKARRSKKKIKQRARNEEKKILDRPIVQIEGEPRWYGVIRKLLDDMDKFGLKADSETLSQMIFRLTRLWEFVKPKVEDSMELNGPQAARFEAAILVFERFRELGNVPSPTTCAAMLKSFFNVDPPRVDEAYQLYLYMSENSIPISYKGWIYLIFGLAKYYRLQEAIVLFKRMRDSNCKIMQSDYQVLMEYARAHSDDDALIDLARLAKIDQGDNVWTKVQENIEEAERLAADIVAKNRGNDGDLDIFDDGFSFSTDQDGYKAQNHQINGTRRDDKSSDRVGTPSNSTSLLFTNMRPVGN